jgi:hypothetical protein
MLRIANVSAVQGFRPAPFTILGWRVASAESTVRELGKKRVEFERFPGMHQNALGIWHSPGGAQVAWILTGIFCPSRKYKIRWPQPRLAP